MKNKKVFWIIVLFIIILTIGLSIYILKNNKENDDITINTPNISKNLFSVNVPEGIKTEIAYIQNNNYLAIVFENKTNENISSGKLKVVIGNKEIEKRRVHTRLSSCPILLILLKSNHNYMYTSFKIKNK